MIICFSTIYGVIIGNYFTSKKWYNAVIHDVPYLYLIQYSLPLNIAIQINKENPATVDFEKSNQVLIPKYMNIKSREKTTITSPINSYTNLTSNDNNSDDTYVNNSSNILLCWHVLSILNVSVAPIFIIFWLAFTNYYQLPHSIAETLQIISLIGFVIPIILVCQYMGY